MFPGEEYEQLTFQLEPEDRLLLYSDGFEMAFPIKDGEKNKIASDQYCREFEGLRLASLDAAIAQLQDKLDAQAGSLNQRDDLTMLCVAATNESAEDTKVASNAAAAQPLHQRRSRQRETAPSPVG